MGKKEKIIIVTINAIFVMLISFAGTYFYKNKIYDNQNNIDIVKGEIDNLLEDKVSYNQIIEEINEVRSSIQPVGSIYMSINDDTVAKVQEKFGGTWAKLENRFLLSASSSYAVNATGGSADAVVVSHTHTLSGTATSAGAHTHSVSGSTGQAIGNMRVVYGAGSSFATNHTTGYVNKGYSDTSTNWPGKAHTHNFTGTAASAGAHTHPLSGTATATGVSGTGKNMPPYYVVYVYKRVS